MLPKLEAAQRALEDAARRRKLAAKLAGGDGVDKRSRPPATHSTKVTPEGKKPCGCEEAPIQPRVLSFSDADDGAGLYTKLNFVVQRVICIHLYDDHQRLMPQDRDQTMVHLAARIHCQQPDDRVCVDMWVM